MNDITIKEFKLIGVALETKTTNENGQSGIDCGTLWQQFEEGNYAAKIQEKLSNEIFAVYYNYEGDYTKPFSYFIGCKVQNDTKVPEGLTSLIIPDQAYRKFVAKGVMPDCVANKWKEIWSTDISRAYGADFEVYDERSKDWSRAEVDIFISLK
ncbi:MAG TPA: GyrI-like domain-containing protein [Hanamia sp.]|nr:GyrI-like domain-containing protein [Hanamia sp.]